MGFQVGYDVWKTIQSDVTYCYSQACPHQKSATTKLKRLKKANIIVANHAMVLMDLQMPNLPEYHYLIIDEAHNFEKCCTMTVEISLKRLNYVIKESTVHIASPFSARPKII